MFKIFLMEGLFLSKAKKIISMLLAVLMVMSVAPASVIASAVEPSATFKAPETSMLTYSTDTMGTTEVIRVAGGAGLFTTGTTIVAATPSGIPKNDSGTYMHIAYDGETPEYPLVSFKIKGTKPTTNPTIVSSLGSNATFKAETVGAAQSDGSYLYTWRLTGGTATAGTVVAYTITYYVEGNNEPQYAYAYSYVEDILIMNGYVAFKRLDSSKHKPATTHSNIVQLGGRNVYPGWYTATEAKARGFINYASGNALSGASLKGAGSEDAMSTEADGYVVDDGATMSGTPKGVLIKACYNQDGGDETRNVMHEADGNRAQSTIYIDKRNETLQSLNVRITLQAGEAGDGSDHGSGETGGNDAYPWPGTNLGGIEVLSGVVTYAVGDSWATAKAKSTSLISIGEISVSSNKTSIADNENYGYIVSHLSGSGPALQNGTTKYQNTTLVYAWETDTNGKGSMSNYETGAIGTVFVVYTTEDLYNIFYGIMAGKNIKDGSSSYTCTDYIKYVANSGETPATSSNLIINFNKGAHPQATQYSAGWDTFLTAYQNAGKILSKPNTNQTEINNAAVALINAYNGLGGFNSNVNYTIKHVKAGTSTEIVNASTEGYTASAQTGTVAAGTKITAYAATIPGYTVSSDSVKTVTFSGRNANETITFEYTPVNVNVNADTNNENLQAVVVDGTEKNLVVQYYPAPYGSAFNLSTATNGDGTASRPGVGKKAGWEFVAWYYAEPADGVSWDESQRIGSSIQISTLNPITIYARWDTAPIHIYATPMLDDGTVINNGQKIDLGSVKPAADGTPINFNRPAASVTVLEGYEFVGLYEKYSNGFQNAVEFPVSFVIGDSDKQVVARYADVKNKIIFESNGGSAIADYNYTVNVAINKSDIPVPTRTGYQFEGWYKNVNFTAGSELFPEGTDSITLTSATGFVVYAKWSAKPLTIKFDTALGASTTKYDTKTIADRVGVVGQVLAAEDVPADPRRFGYVFAGWLYNGRPFSFDAALPVADDQITLVANWRKTDDSAFIELNAIEKNLGQEVYLDTDDTTDDDNIVQQGDVITVRMTSKTNFYVGSSLFIFMYDSSFYELVGSGKDAFTLNYEDSYIKGINAKHSAVTNSDVLPWPDGLDKSTYNAIQIAIDPTVSADNYNAEPMDGKTWMVEFKLKVKDTAEGEGTIYMDNAWTRTPDNVMGTMFYGWAESAATSVIDTENNKVTPDLYYASRTLKIDTEEPVKTTVNLDANGGAWADGDTTKTYANGNAGSEIAGYTKPTRTGYELADGAWYAVAGDTTSAQWIEGYYPPEDTLTATYYANWTPKNYPVVFHWEQGSDEVYREISVPYQTEIAADAVANPSKSGYSFAGWTDADGNLVTLPMQMNTADDNGIHLYATWVPASDIKFTIKVNYILQNTGATQSASQTKDKAGNAFQGMTGQTVALVEAIPENADPNTLYITVDQIPVIQGGNYFYNAELNTPDEFGHIATGVIKADGSLVLEVNYDAKMMTFTFNANGGTFADGTDTLIKTGKFLSAFDGLTDEELPTKPGYDFAGWSSAVAANFRADLTYTAKWTAKKSHVRFMLSETEQYGTLIEVDVGKAPATPAEPTKAGYTFVGWNTDPNATTGVKVIPAVETPDTAEGYAITYYAIYTLTPYTVVYYTVDPVTDAVEQYGETETYYLNDVVTVKDADLVMKGYDFSGWVIDDEAAGETFVMPGNNVEIYGAFTAKTINVKFYADEGAYADGAEYVEVATAFNTEIALPAAAPAKAGYDFLGWATEADATSGSTALGVLTEEEASYYAVYAPQMHTYYIDVYEMGLDGQYVLVRTETAEGYVDSTVEITSADDVTGFTLVTPATQNGVVPAEGELRFTVQYERNTYTINYIVEGVETPVEYLYGATIDAANEPAKVKKGHTFTGWSPALPETMPAGDLETVAQFDANSYTVTYISDGTVVATESVVYGKDIPSKNQTKTGYTFLGWAYEGTTDVVVSATSSVQISDSDVTLVAVWSVNEYRLNYIGASGVHEYFMVAYGTPASEWPVPSVDPVKEGSYFNGWKASAYATMPTEVVNLQANWVVETYKFQFANTGDTVIDEITVTYGEAFDGVADPEWAGHVFAGWDKEIPADITDLGENGAVTVFTADWTLETYTLKFADTGDAAIADITVTYGDTIDAIADPTKTGHVFAGWDKVIPTEIGDLGEDGAVITYTAKWTKETYTLTFADTGDTTIADKTVKYGDTIAAVADPSWKGYVFAGWDVTPPTAIGDLGENGAVITYTAQWSLDQFTITFDADGGTDVAPITDDYTATINAPAEPTKTGYVFAGWINSNGETVTFPITMPSENLALKAVWTAETYTIKFADTDDAGTVIEMNVTFGDTIAAPTGLTKTGYVFAGWDVTPPTTVGDLGENGAVVTYTAQWTKKTYTINFVDTGDTTIETMVVEFGDTITVPADLTKDGQGYYFTGAWKDANGNAATPPATITDMGANGAEFTYVAQWAKETYTIAFDANGGSAVESIVKQYGDVVIVPAAPTKEGHSFVQWNDADNNKYEIQTLMPDLGENNATITLTAQWQKNVYNVVFFDAYGEIFTTVSIEFDANIADYVPATLPEKEHYITLGWSTVQDDTVAITDFGKMPANANLVFYPALERVEVTLALKEGTTAEVFETELDETDLDNPVKVGYIRGLDTQLTKSALESIYLGVTGDGTVIVTPSWNAFNICGTGTTVEIYDNVEGKVVEKYYVVIYGDVNGDSAVSATDIPVINKEVLGATCWSFEDLGEYNKAMVLAANLRDDGQFAIINTLDASIIRDVTLSVAYIDQTTGEVIYY